MDAYDEFGNYIGGDLSGSDSDSGSDSPRAHGVASGAGSPASEAEMPDYDAMEVDDSSKNAIILHEDKRYYDPANEVYGEGVETLVQEEDAQPLSKPIVEPIRTKTYGVAAGDRPETTWDTPFLEGLARVPDKVRNVAVVGQLHHGKTSLIDMLVLATHELPIDVDAPTRYTDTHAVSRARAISTKAAAISLVLADSAGESRLFHVIDTPGHVDFADEAACALRAADGAVVVVDAAEGVCAGTRAALGYCARHRIPVVLVVSKFDRLILELRLPPQDAYFKLRHTVEEANAAIAAVDPSPALRVSPERGNVAFASADLGVAFTLASFAARYGEPALAPRLWGNVFFDPAARTFSSRAADGARTFEHFVLEPLYKLAAAVLSERGPALAATLASLDVTLKAHYYALDARPLLRVVFAAFLGSGAPPLADVLARLPSPADGTRRTETTYGGDQGGAVAEAMRRCAADGPLAVNVVKLLPAADATSWWALARVASGTLRVGARVAVLGEAYTADDDEDRAVQTVDALAYAGGGRYATLVDSVPAGNVVLIGGIDGTIDKTATVVAAAADDADDAADAAAGTFAPIAHTSTPVVKLALEPAVPSELPKMLAGLRALSRTYPVLRTRVEENGEHVILGTGELYLDCALYDLRTVFGELEVKVSDPSVQFCETVVETSALQCVARTPNQKNTLTMISEPLERGVAGDIESGVVAMSMPPRELGAAFQARYGWDLLASRSIWAFGPDVRGPNVLLDDTLPSDVDKKLLYSLKEPIKQGFHWACREGPLCDEPVRGVKFRLLAADIAAEPVHRGRGQIIPTARRVCYSSLLTATPRLLEPVYSLELTTPQDCIPAIYEVLARRRGHVTRDAPKPGTPLYTVEAYLPVVDSFGFETDLRTHTLGQAFSQQTFDHWSLCPGDPLDKSIVLKPLEAAPAQHLARDFVLKARRRKGLNDEINVTKYLEADTLAALAAADLLEQYV